MYGNLTKTEHREMITLEYVLTQGYSDNVKKETKRYMKLVAKKHKEIL